MVRRGIVLGGFLALVLALVLSHQPLLGSAWRGETYLGCALAEPRCDALHTLVLAEDARLRLVAAWDGVEGPGAALRFLLRDAWQVAVEARVLNLADVALLVWPLRALLDVGPALVVLHLGLVLLAAAGGALLARTLGAGGPGVLAAAGVAAGSGLVEATVAQGQYAQALVAPGLLLLAGVARILRGQGGGVVLAVTAGSLALLLYWQNGLILGAGVLALLLGARLGGWPRPPGAAWRLVAVPALIALICLPAALPVLGATGTEDKLAGALWGGPWPSAAARAALGPHAPARLVVLDAVPLETLLSPATGWLLPALPLVPLLLVGAARRRALPWVILWTLSALLVVGPLPAWEASANGGAEGPLPNPAWTLPWQWVPTFARMYHPLRWGLLGLAAVAALVASGADTLASRWPRATSILALAAIPWVALVGPWPLQAHPFPGAVERALAGCPEVLLAPVRAGPTTRRSPDEGRLLQGVHRRPTYPISHVPGLDAPPPTPEEARRSLERQVALDAALTGGAAALPPGACIVVDVDVAPVPEEMVRTRFDPHHGPPRALVLPAGCLPGSPAPRRLLVWAVAAPAGGPP